MLKKISCILITISMLLSVCIVSSSATTSKNMNKCISDPVTFVSSLTGDGKRFEDGIIQPVLSTIDLDISLSSFIFRENAQESVYDVSFLYDDNNFLISGYLIPAKFNNYYNDHFLLSPVSFTSSSEEYEFTKVLVAFNANEHDLLPPNQYMAGQTVITIWLTEKSTGDLLMWQVLVPSQTHSAFIAGNLDITEENQNLIASANEYFFAENTSISVEITKEEYDRDAAAIVAGTYVNEDDPALLTNQPVVNLPVVSDNRPSQTASPNILSGDS